MSEPDVKAIIYDHWETYLYLCYLMGKQPDTKEFEDWESVNYGEA